jgi:hypothetical protein
MVPLPMSAMSLPGSRFSLRISAAMPSFTSLVRFRDALSRVLENVTACSISPCRRELPPPRA